LQDPLYILRGRHEKGERSMKAALKLIRILTVVLIPAAMALGWVEHCFAHRVNVFAWIEGDVIRVDAGFAGGRKVKGGDVRVLDESGSILHEGKTDEGGGYCLKIPAKGALKIVVEAGLGHRGEWTVSAADSKESSPSEAAPPSGAEDRPDAEPGESSKTEGKLMMSSEEIGRIVEKAVEKKIEPLISTILDTREKEFSLRDIMGGIGYIIGLVGLGAYLRSKRHAPGDVGR
jgi:nickel transport protein